MFKNFILVILVSLVLPGCMLMGPKYNKLETKEVVIQKIKVQEELLVPCDPEKVMVKENYLKLKPHEKEIYLTNYSIGLLGTVKNCNIKLSKIKEFSDAQ